MMSHSLPASMALLLSAAMVLVDPAASSGWVPNPSCRPYPKYKELGEFAVNRYNEKNHGSLRFVAVKNCYVLDRGTGHYTYRFVTIVNGGNKYKTEVLEDLSAPGDPPVHNFGYFISLEQSSQPPKWQQDRTCQPYAKYRELGLFAVHRYNEQNHGRLRFREVKHCWVLDRGTGHYTYRFITIVRGGRKYKTEVLEDLSAPGYSPVRNFGFFRPIWMHLQVAEASVLTAICCSICRST